MPRLADVVAALDARADPRTAEVWDAVGLVCGDPDDQVDSVLFAVDPLLEVADEAVAGGFDLLVTHHPLYLRGTTTVAATTAKGRVVSRLLRAGAGLHVAHTNADVAAPGVSDALAQLLGLVELQPLRPSPTTPALDALSVHVPPQDAPALVAALHDAGAGALGDYTHCAWSTRGIGQFLPQEGADPAIGEVGELEFLDELRVELVMPRARRATVVAALRAAHPYEEPAFSVVEMADVPDARGLGRVGVLPEPVPFGEFVARAAAALPATAAGLRAAGDPERPVTRVAVCGGSGDSLLGDARAAGVDVFLTADLRHHPVSESLADGGPMLVDAPHWATEQPWLVGAARRLADDTGVRTAVSARVTDPWTVHAPSHATGTGGRP